MIRKKNMKSTLKYGIIIGVWILYLIVILTGQKDSDKSSNISENTKEDNISEQVSTETIGVNASTEIVNESAEDFINYIVDEYNSQASELLIFEEGFTPSDKKVHIIDRNLDLLLTGILLGNHIY